MMWIRRIFGGLRNNQQHWKNSEQDIHKGFLLFVRIKVPNIQHVYYGQFEPLRIRQETY